MMMLTYQKSRNRALFATPLYVNRKCTDTLNKELNKEIIDISNNQCYRMQLKQKEVQ